MKVKLILALVVGWFAFQWARGFGVEDVTVDPSAQATWMTDAPAALAKAERENKLVLMNFTGSDWCGWCIKLDAEVFSKAEFATYAQKHLVLLKLDFPRRKAQGAAERKQNDELAQKFGIRGFPTIVLASPSGKERGRLGYRRGGPKAWLGELEELR